MFIFLERNSWYYFVLPAYILVIIYLLFRGLSMCWPAFMDFYHNSTNIWFSLEKFFGFIFITITTNLFEYFLGKYELISIHGLDFSLQIHVYYCLIAFVVIPFLLYVLFHYFVSNPHLFYGVGRSFNRLFGPFIINLMRRYPRVVQFLNSKYPTFFRVLLKIVLKMCFCYFLFSSFSFIFVLGFHIRRVHWFSLYPVVWIFYLLIYFILENYFYELDRIWNYVLLDYYLYLLAPLSKPIYGSWSPKMQIHYNSRRRVSREVRWSSFLLRDRQGTHCPVGLYQPILYNFNDIPYGDRHNIPDFQVHSLSMHTHDGSFLSEIQLDDSFFSRQFYTGTFRNLRAELYDYVEDRNIFNYKSHDVFDFLHYHDLTQQLIAMKVANKWFECHNQCSNSLYTANKAIIRDFTAYTQNGYMEPELLNNSYLNAHHEARANTLSFLFELSFSL